uniref:hypothetical protein n=1 Tax=Mycoplasmopsis bovis TaxID=28903 RepID=UPI003D26DF48
MATTASLKILDSSAVVKLARSFLNNIKRSDSAIASEMKKIEESETFISTFKQNIIVEQYNVLYRELKTAKNGDENESSSNKSVPEFLKKFE